MIMDLYLKINNNNNSFYNILIGLSLSSFPDIWMSFLSCKLLFEYKEEKLSPIIYFKNKLDKEGFFSSSKLFFMSIWSFRFCEEKFEI